MRTLFSAIAIVAFSHGVFGAVPMLGAGPDAAGQADPLVGKWIVIAGEVRDEGYYFDPQVRRSCGTAEFRHLVRGQMANFAPEGRRNDRAAPWGQYEAYRFDANGVLTLRNYREPDVRCFLKFKATPPPREGETEKQNSRLHVCVFYEPRGRRAFKLFRREEIGRLANPSETTGGGAVFVPHEDVLTGAWLLPPGRRLTDGKLEFPLSQTAPAGAARLEVNVDNSVEFRTGGRSVHFRLRQCDPTHWAIESDPCTGGQKGTILLERDAGRVVGGNVLFTRWHIGTQTMTAVLLAEGGRRRPNVPTVRFEGAAPLDVQALLSLVRTNPPPEQ